ncbi:MAG: hypothetical protein M3R25_10455, partial [Bacteroidota bacterium]|nr:hypothetical protein [Bacteroidota bacterium]
MKLITLSAFSLLATFSFAQPLLYNDGAMIKVQTGAVLYVEGGIQNTATGTIDNDGTIELKGNFVNAGMWEPSQPNILKFSGDASSTVTSGNAVYQSVVVQKGNNFNVTLVDNMTVNTNLDFNAAGSTRLATASSANLKIGPVGTVTGYDSDEYVATEGTGVMEKAVTANGTFFFPVGDLINYSPLSSTYTGSAYAAATLKTKVNDLTHPNKPADASDFISRYWDVDAAGISTYTNSLTGTYIPADLTGTASLVKGAVYDGVEWSYADAAAGANIVIGSTNDAIADFTGTNFFGKAILKVFLSSSLPSSGVPPMNTAINSVIPLGSPYSATPWNAPVVTAPSIPATATDWILVETRDASINIISQTSAFLLSTGTIVNPDGTPLTLKNAVSSAIVSIRHRNHLGIRTIGNLDLVNPTMHDFSTGTGQAYTNTTIAPIPPNTNMRLIGSTYALW